MLLLLFVVSSEESSPLHPEFSLEFLLVLFVAMRVPLPIFKLCDTFKLIITFKLNIPATVVPLPLLLVVPVPSVPLVVATHSKRLLLIKAHSDLKSCNTFYHQMCRRGHRFF